MTDSILYRLDTNAKTINNIPTIAETEHLATAGGTIEKSYLRSKVEIRLVRPELLVRLYEEGCGFCAMLISWSCYIVEKSHQGASLSLRPAPGNSHVASVANGYDKKKRRGVELMR